MGSSFKGKVCFLEVDASGAGVLFDASARGLKCCLVEQDDFASGTSSKSTKLIHGGIRYLQKAFEDLDPGQ